MHTVKELSTVREEVCDECNKHSTKMLSWAIQKVTYVCPLLPKICETWKKEKHSWKDVSHNIPFNKVQYVEFDIKCAIIFVIYEFPAGTCGQKM
jgi:hypothetical protein